MAGRTTVLGLTGPGFIADHGSEIRSAGGRQIAWALVVAAFGAAGSKHIPAGTVMSEITADTNDVRNVGKVIPRSQAVPAGSTTSGGARFIAETEMDEANRNHALSGYGMLVGGHLYENLLPDSAGNPKVLPAAFKAELDVTGRALFLYSQYQDNRGS